MQARQRFCSLSCAAEMVDPAVRAARARLGGQAAAAAAEQRRTAKYTRVYEKVGATRAGSFFYRLGYKAGLRARRYVELREQALARLQRASERDHVTAPAQPSA